MVITATQVAFSETQVVLSEAHMATSTTITSTNEAHMITTATPKPAPMKPRWLSVLPETSSKATKKWCWMRPKSQICEFHA